MPYCRYCGCEITYKRTKNDHWMPCNLLTGEKHFCREDGNTAKSGLSVCETCGKPVFESNGKIMDYTTLLEHKCMKGDTTRYTKYKENERKKVALKAKAEQNAKPKKMSEKTKTTKVVKKKTERRNVTATKTQTKTTKTSKRRGMKK